MQMLFNVSRCVNENKQGGLGAAYVLVIYECFDETGKSVGEVQSRFMGKVGLTSGKSSSYTRIEKAPDNTASVKLKRVYKSMGDEFEHKAHLISFPCGQMDLQF